MPSNDKVLFLLASDDFIACEALINMGIVSHVVFFHAQQTVEKCIKSVLAKNNIIFPRTHDIIELSALLAKNNLHNPITSFWVEELNDLAVESRYFVPEVEFPDAKEVLKVAKTAIDWCREQINAKSQ